MRIVLVMSLLMFVLGKIKNERASKSSYFNRLGMPNVYVSSQCPNKGDCWPVIRNQDGRVLRSYSSSDSLGTISSGRYKNVAYLYYSYTYGSKKDRHTKYYLIDQNSKEYNIPSTMYGYNLDSIIEVGENGVYKNGNEILTNELRIK